MKYVNKERIQKDINTLGLFTSTPGKGVTQVTYSKQDRKAREYLMGEMLDLGLKISVD